MTSFCFSLLFMKRGNIGSLPKDVMRIHTWETENSLTLYLMKS